MVCKLKKILVKIVVSNLQTFLVKQIISIFQVGILNFEKKKVSSSWTSKFIRRRIQLYVKNVRCRISLLALKITWKLKLTTSTYIQSSRSKMESQFLVTTSVSKLQNSQIMMIIEEKLQFCSGLPKAEIFGRNRIF